MNTPDCLNCENKSSTLQMLNLYELEEYKHHCNHVYFDKGETIYKQGAPISQVSYLKTGLVKIVQNNCKRNFIHCITSYNEFLGLTDIFYHSNYMASAITLAPTEICHIDRCFFLDLIERNGKFAKAVLHQLSQKSSYSLERIVNLIHKQLPGRLADMLLFFMNEVFKTHQFEIPLSRMELADYVGVAKKSFIRTLMEFKNDGIIDVDGKKLEIIEYGLLERLSKLG